MAYAGDYDGTDEEQCREWIEDVLDEPLDEDPLGELLRSGVLLCNFANRLSPGAVPKVSDSSKPFPQRGKAVQHQIQHRRCVAKVTLHDVFRLIDRIGTSRLARVHPLPTLVDGEGKQGNGRMGDEVWVVAELREDRSQRLGVRLTLPRLVRGCARNGHPVCQILLYGSVDDGEQVAEAALATLRRFLHLILVARPLTGIPMNAGPLNRVAVTLREVVYPPLLVENPHVTQIHGHRRFQFDTDVTLGVVQ
jgi:hypothetical protein